MQQQTLIQTAEQLCRDWWYVHRQLLDEPDHYRRERLLYEEFVLERKFNALTSAYRYHACSGGR